MTPPSSRLLSIPNNAVRYTDLDLRAFYVSTGLPDDLMLHVEDRASRTYLVVEAIERDVLTAVLMTQLRARDGLVRASGHEVADVR